MSQAFREFVGITEATSAEEVKKKYLERAAEYIVGEFDDQAGTAIDLTHKIELKNVDLLSDKLIAHRGVHDTIKQAIRERSENVRKIISGIAYLIEQENIHSIDEAVSRFGNLSLIDRRKVENLASSQKKLGISFSSISAVIDIFSLAMQKIAEEATRSDASAGHSAAISKTSLYLKHSIIVYELTSFIIEYVSKFGLDGADDLRKVRDDVMEEINTLIKENRSIEARAAKEDPEMRDTLLENVRNKAEIYQTVIHQWEEMMKMVGGLEDSIKESKGILSTLTLLRDNARNDMGTLNVIATTAVVKNSLKSIDSFAARIKKYSPPPLNEKLARELLGLGKN